MSQKSKPAAAPGPATRHSPSTRITRASAEGATLRVEVVEMPEHIKAAISQSLSLARDKAK